MQSINWQFIDKVIYINLSKRKDRNVRLKRQLNKAGLSKDKIIRFEAFEETSGYIGCTKSHIAALEMAQAAGWRNVLILEDDIVFNQDDKSCNRLNQYFNALQHIQWDVAFLAANYSQVVPMKSVDYLIKANSAWCACAYLVNQHYYSTLIANFQQGLAALQQGGAIHHYALDVYWQRLMQQDAWLGIYPNFGYQMADMSDIEQTAVDYRHLFNKPLSEIQQYCSTNNNMLSFFMETIENALFYCRIINALPPAKQKNIVVFTPWETIHRQIAQHLRHCQVILLMDYGQRPDQQHFRLNKPAINKIVDENIRSSREFLIQKASYDQCWDTYFFVLFSLMKQKAINNIAKMILCSGNSLPEKAAALVCQQNKIETRYTELSNLPNKVFIDRLGVNARAEIAINPAILAKLSSVSDDFHEAWMAEYEKGKQGIPLQAVGNICSKLIDKLSTDNILNNKHIKFLFLPLQVSYDTQLWMNSDFRNKDAIHYAFEQAKNDNLILVVKIHPAETDIEEYKMIAELQKIYRFKISKENTVELLKRAIKVLTINSTVGLEAKLYNKPVEFLGRSFFKNMNREDIKKYIHHYLISGIEVRSSEAIPYSAALAFVQR